MEENKSLKEAILELNLLTSEQFDQYVVPSDMISPTDYNEIANKKNNKK
jgi:fumarate hydratase class II